MRRRQLATLAAAALVAPLAVAQERHIKILVGFAAGGSVDAVARLLANALRRELGKNATVDNRPGASGRLALSEVKRAASDGQTLILSPSGPLVTLPHLYTVAQLGYDPVADFTPISCVTTFDFAVTAGPAAHGSDLKSILAWMKANPDKANYAMPGNGTVPHFAGQMLAQAAGIRMTPIAYRGGAPAVQDLIGGQVPLMVDTATETIEHHISGKVRILAVTGERRNRALPEVQTLKEQGLNVVADAFFGLYGPHGMAPDVVERIDRAVRETLQAQDVKERIYSIGLVPSHGSSAQLAAIQLEHLHKWQAPIEASGFKPE